MSNNVHIITGKSPATRAATDPFPLVSVIFTPSFNDAGTEQAK